jgi:Protein of unknown function (DUF732)
VDEEKKAPSRHIGALVIIGSAMALLAAACGGHTATNDAADQQFLGAIHDAAPNIGSYRTDTELVRIGHAACDGFRSHASYEQLADRLTLEEGSNPLPSEDLGTVITSAVEAFCPQFDSQVS